MGLRGVLPIFTCTCKLKGWGILTIHRYLYALNHTTALSAYFSIASSFLYILPVSEKYSERQLNYWIEVAAPDPAGANNAFYIGEST